MRAIVTAVFLLGSTALPVLSCHDDAIGELNSRCRSDGTCSSPHLVCEADRTMGWMPAFICVPVRRVAAEGAP